MTEKHEPRILPFVPLDRERLEHDIDQEIIDRERAKEFASMADDALANLDFDRLIKGEVR